MIHSINVPYAVTKVLDFVKSNNKGSCDLVAPVGHGYFTMLVNGLREEKINFNEVRLCELISNDFNEDGSSIYSFLNYCEEVVIIVGADGCDPKINVHKYVEYLVKNGCTVVVFL